MTSRRNFVLSLPAGILVCGWAAAQPTAERRRIGFLEAGSASANQHFLDAFRAGMRERGYEEGRNIVIDVRWADGRAERFPELLDDLLSLRPDVIVVASSLGAVAARKVVASVPVVFVGVSDPVNLGLVTNLARPGGNMTGLSRVFGEGLLGKALQLLHDIVPQATRIAILYNPQGEVDPRVAEAQNSMRALKMTPLRFEMRDARSLDDTFAAMRVARVDALLVVADPLTLRHRDAIVQRAAAARVPAVYEFAEFARAGGLIAYSASVRALFERAAVYVDKILKGADPGTLPVEQPTKFDLVVNLRTAKALGLAIPQSLLLRADEVIQ
ncbi:MAG: ABC transporter substrate-binding protein [Burkholderiales bacterium]